MSNGHTNDAFEGDLDPRNNTTIQDKTPVAVQKHGGEEEAEISCGIGKLRTRAFGKCFANLYVFSFLMGMSSCFSVMIFQNLSIQIKYIQRQFDIDTTTVGLFMTATRIGSVSTVLLSGHFAPKLNIPLVIGISGLVQGLALLVPTIMQFANPCELPVFTETGPVVGGNSSLSANGSVPHFKNPGAVCLSDEVRATMPGGFSNHTGGPGHTILACTDNEGMSAMFNVLLVVLVIKGMTDSFHSSSLPYVYLDDNTYDKTRMGFYIGVLRVLTAIATPVGTEFNGLLTRLPVDLKDTELTPQDPRYVSAWWLAFCVSGVGTVVFSTLTMLFPKKLISVRQQEEALQSAMVSFAGGNMREDVQTEEPISDKIQEEEDNRRKHSVVVTSISNAVEVNGRKRSSLGVTAQKLGDSRKGSVVSNGSRRASLYPPIVGPTERRASIASVLNEDGIVFDQPKKPEPLVKEKGLKKLLVIFKDFPSALLRVLKVPAFVLILIDVFVISIPSAGIGALKAKYINQEYNIGMEDVAHATAISTAVASFGGTIIGGFISSRVKKRMGYVWIIFVTYMFGVLMAPCYLIFGCENQKVVGLEGDFGIPYNSSASCECPSDATPLVSCGEDGLQYLSPCYAGCSVEDGKLFRNCSQLLAPHTGGMVTPGVCDAGCDQNFLIYVVLHGAQNLIENLSNIPRSLLILRIVDPRDRAFSISLFAFSYMMVSIGSPNLFGKLIDEMCIVWSGHTCFLYDRDMLRYLIAGIDASVHVTILITVILMIITFKWEDRKNKKKAQAEKDKLDTVEKNVQSKE